jgi:hypothetical protein
MKIQMPSVAALAAACALLASQPASAYGQTGPLEIELEAGAVWQSYNDVEIPNDGTASRFSLAELAGTGPWAAGRLYVTWHLTERDDLRLLAAPFSITETGTPEGPLSFAGASYALGAPVEATYTFNSYRLSYRRRVHSGASTTAWIGFTAKLRDATVALSQGATTSRKDDLGFVPLLHVAADWRPSPLWRLALDADGLAGGPGRAVDASLKLAYEPNQEWSLNAGYRTLEGGADVEEVYSFAWLHYAVLSVAWRP